jgi:hypothetical protein
MRFIISSSFVHNAATVQRVRTPLRLKTRNATFSRVKMSARSDRAEHLMASRLHRSTVAPAMNEQLEERMTTMVFKAAGIVIAAGAIAGASARVAAADELVDAKVPFAFVVNGIRLPAGSYRVRQMDEGSSVLAIVSADGREFVLASTIPAGTDQPTSDPQLVFQKFEGQIFLSRIVSASGTEREIILTPSIMETALARTNSRELPATPADTVR